MKHHSGIVLYKHQ